MNPTVYQLVKMIDHSILHPAFTDEDLKRECEVARKYEVASVCVKPYAVEQAVKNLRGSNVRVGCVVGFPAGNSTTIVKTFEAEEACLNGATEIDMVINIGKALQGDWKYVKNEIREITEVCHSYKAIVKVIFETDYVNKDEDIVKLCEICTEVGADYVKTSTGFGFVKQANGDYNYSGTTIPVLELMKRSVGPKVKVKAAGGIRTLDQLLAVQAAGASRCWATATASIIEEAMKRFGE